MVEQATLSNIFKSLSDPTRRDILARVYEKERTISELSENYDMSFAGIAKHINVLEAAGLVSKNKKGKEQIITIGGESFELANSYLQDYAVLWSERFDRMEEILNTEKQNER